MTAPSPNVNAEEALRTRIESFADLGPNWDSYGADPLDPTVIDRAVRVAALLSHLQAAPGADGSVSFEGHNRDDDIVIAIEPDRATLFVSVAGFEYEATLPDPADAGVTVRPALSSTEAGRLREAARLVAHTENCDRSVFACEDCLALHVEDCAEKKAKDKPHDTSWCGSEHHRALVRLRTALESETGEAP
jgi:hypothetical protein